MKRKRDVDLSTTRTRPFKKREELLNDCLSLCLQYNTHFSLCSTDLSWYRYAESLEDRHIPEVIHTLKNAIETDEYVEFDQIVERI